MSTSYIDSDRYINHTLLRRSAVVWLILAAFLSLGAWAYVYELDEVSTGTGKVVASSKAQLVQSLEGGVLHQLFVKEGDIVEPGQILAQLDRTKFESSVQESETQYIAALATVDRLTAEAEEGELRFSGEVRSNPGLTKAETALYKSRKNNFRQTLKGLEDEMSLIRRELLMLIPLVEKGAASDVEVLRLERQLHELKRKKSDFRTQYFVQVREELAEANEKAQSLLAVIRGRADSLNRLSLYSPVRGVVKDITVTTVGGVVPPNGSLMEIIPLDDTLQVEARISPRDIAHIYPGQEATVKVTAYDYSLFGGLKGNVTIISPDTIQDEVHPDQYYYRVTIRTETDTLVNAAGKKMPISPGMICTVDVHTGSKTVLSYLVKPLNKTREALRER